jgi:hypothetical protein
VKTYGEVVEEYEFHPESKCSDGARSACSKQTIGLLHRRWIRANEIRFIGKESNILEDVESGSVHSDRKAYSEYTDPRRDEWTMKLQLALKTLPLRVLVKERRGRLSRRALIDLRAGRSRPHRKNQELLATIVGKLRVT